MFGMRGCALGCEGVRERKREERGVVYMEDNKRIREMCNNNGSEFNYTEQHRC